MLKAVQDRLSEANKLIFVKRYGDAEYLLESILATPEGQLELLVHLRRIELAAMLKKLDKTRSNYLAQLKGSRKSQSADVLAALELALALTEQHGDLVSAGESITIFQDLLKRLGPSPAAYYGIGYSLEQQGSFERAIYSYQQALSLDPDWTPAYFGLSQIHYQMGDEKKGDQFFYLFEQASPFNVYGNFETHRKLCQEFLAAERFAEAESAIQALPEWWIENKGACPTEIQIYESLALARISEARGDKVRAETLKIRAKALSLGVLEDAKTPEGVLYFVAKVLEEHGDFPQALNYYKRILQGQGGSPGVVQKIGSQFLSLGEFKLAKELFEEAYISHPEHPDIRFCLLVANLKLAGVNVEEYLIGRERLRQLTQEGGDRVELLALLHSLLAKYSGDGDVQGSLADLYLRLGNVERAERHFTTMFQLDGLSRSTALKYAAFLMQYRDPDKAMEVLSKVEPEGLSTEHRAEIYWLKSSFHARRGEHQESLKLLRKVLALDPWNVSYLVQEVINLIKLSEFGDELGRIDSALAALSTTGDESKLEWQEFDQITVKAETLRAYELVYARRKLRYLYANGAETHLQDLVRAACHHDPARATYDFMKLLNTNFDSHNIYWALGTLFKELWQLETAAVWFEQMLLYPGLQKEAQAKAYLELADTFAWQGRFEMKAIEYAKLAVDLSDLKDNRSFRVLAHAYLKAGQVRQAKLYLEQIGIGQDHEARYLTGLLHYRNGSRQEANKTWKPLLTITSESLRFHNIKQEILKFYFDGAPYLKAN